MTSSTTRLTVSHNVVRNSYTSTSMTHAQPTQKSLAYKENDLVAAKNKAQMLSPKMKCSTPTSSVTLSKQTHVQIKLDKTNYSRASIDNGQIHRSSTKTQDVFCASQTYVQLQYTCTRRINSEIVLLPN
jgi:hypothetical protein